MTLAIPIRERNDASQANCFGFCTCAPSFRSEEPTPLLSADTKPPRICTFHSYLKSRIFNARAAHSVFFRPTPFVCADARYRGWGRYSVLKSKCVALIPRFPVPPHSPRGHAWMCEPGSFPSSPFPASHSRALCVPSGVEGPPATRHCLCNSFGLHTSESRFRNSFRLHTYVMWGGGVGVIGTDRAHP